MFKSIISIVFIGSAVVIFMIYIKPTYDATLVNKVKITHLDTSLKTMRLTQNRTNTLLTRYNDAFTSNDINRLDKMLPDHVNNVRLVLDIDSMANKYGVQIKNVQIQKPKDISASAQAGTVLRAGNKSNLPYQSLTLQFDVVSTYSNFLLLLRDLESSLRIVDLVRLSIAPVTSTSTNVNGTAQTTQTPYYTFSVSLRTYWLR